MKTIGLLGGMSWQSTIDYYRFINEGVMQRLGERHSAKIVMCSIDHVSILPLMDRGEWQEVGQILASSVRSIEAGEADFFLICCNSAHKVAEMVSMAVDIPLLHIGDAIGEVLVRDGVKKVGLVGTLYTMEETFYRDRLTEKFNLDVLVPEKGDRQFAHNVIVSELCLGRIRDQSRQEFIRIIELLADAGAEAIILGCTEIGMLIGENDTVIPLYDSVKIHAARAVELACHSTA